MELMLRRLIEPNIWFLFFPAVFASAWLGGRAAGSWASVFSTALVWWFLVPPEHSFDKTSFQVLFPSAVFVTMGVVFSVFHDRLRVLNRQATSARDNLVRAQSVANVGSWELDIRRGELRWTDETYRIFAVPKGTPMTYESFMACVHPDDRELVKRAWEAALAGKPYDLEHRIVAAGVVKWVRERAELVLDDRHAAQTGVGTVQDVTERRAAEAELRASERQLSAIYANVTAILFYVAVEPGERFRFVSVNQAFLDATGLSREQVVGKLVQDVIPEPSRAMVLANYREALRTKQTVRWEEVSVYPAGTRYGEVALTPALDESGVATHVVGIVKDVTTSKLAEQALHEAADRKDDFIAALSHELRNPITAIRNSVSVLERVPLGDERAPRMRASIVRQVSHLTRLVDDLLDVTRISHGKIQLRLQQVDLGVLVRDVADDQKEAFKESGILFEVTRPDHPIWAAVDPTRMTQVLDNLLTNAAKFTPSGGRAELSLESAGDWAVIRVRDNGPGIAPEVMAHLFEPFVQAVHTLNRSRAGLGLGLTLVKGLVELHGGTVSVASEGSGHGAEFTVRLPLGQARAAVASTAHP
ncbi:MAG: PAS domain S-box protein [Deltaproteobacteria bacterium]|nr:PAS domain S-box protein [Deltaproteobacteria bacterium]